MMALLNLMYFPLSIYRVVNSGPDYSKNSYVPLFLKHLYFAPQLRETAKEFLRVCDLKILKVKARGDRASHERVFATGNRPGAEPVSGWNNVLQLLLRQDILPQR
jgi:hypothetical protein